MARALWGLLALVMGCAAAPKVPQRPTPGQPSILVMTYNVNFGLGGREATINAIRRAQADVVFLQETSPAWEEALCHVLCPFYPHMAFHHDQAEAGGLGVLSLHPFQVVRLIPPPEGGWFPAWLLCLQTPLGPIQALNVHLRPPFTDEGDILLGYFLTPKVRLRQMKHYLSHLDPSLPTLIAGDFNEHGCCKVVPFLAQRGLRSALPQFAPGRPTWHWRTVVGTITSQLDHIVYNERLRPLRAWVQEEGSSDHYPLLATFESSGPSPPSEVPCLENSAPRSSSREPD